MGRYEDYQNLIDAKILQGLQWSAVVEATHNADEGRWYLNASYNSLKALKDANTNVMLHIVETNGGEADLYIPLAVIYKNTSDEPVVYGAYFLGVEEFAFEANDPDEYLFYND